MGILGELLCNSGSYLSAWLLLADENMYIWFIGSAYGLWGLHMVYRIYGLIGSLSLLLILLLLALYSAMYLALCTVIALYFTLFLKPYLGLYITLDHFPDTLPEPVCEHYNCTVQTVYRQCVKIMTHIFFYIFGIVKPKYFV
jgi:hypothetical protein